MKMLCISTFGRYGRLKYLTLNRIYECKFHYSDEILIIDDSGKPAMRPKLNFLSWKKMANFESIMDIK